MILEAIYEPTFLECSHGFRSGKSCLTALNHIRTNFDEVSYMIVGDIQECDGSLNNEVLVTLLKRRIKDQRFINLIYKFLKAGYFETKNQSKRSFSFLKLEASHDSGLSPMLTNIYFHELDKFVIHWIADNYEPCKNLRNPKKFDLISEIQSLEKQLSNEKDGFCRKKLIKRIKQVKIDLTKKPSIKRGLKAYYVRYADDWVIGINGTASKAKSLKLKINEFIFKELNFNLNEKRNPIYDLKAGHKVSFLGYEIRVKSQEPVTKIRPGHRPASYRNTVPHKIQLCIPHQIIVHGLYRRGYCDVYGYPLAYKKWSVLDDHLIVRSLNRIRAELLNYYSLADDSNIFFRIDYILRYSLAKTLAHRHQSSIRKIFRKHGLTVAVAYKTQTGKMKKILMPKFKTFNPKLKKSLISDPFEVDRGQK